MRFSGKLERVLLAIFILLALNLAYELLPVEIRFKEEAVRDVATTPPTVRFRTHTHTHTHTHTPVLAHVAQTTTEPEVFLVIMILASEKGLDRRNAIRETWASVLPE
jgi:hypothetical protein